MNCEAYRQYFSKDCAFFDSEKNPVEINECLGCYIDNYCKYIAKMFEINPNESWWLQPRLFLYFLGFSGIVMASIGFYIYAKLSDIYPYNFVAYSCLVEAAIYFRFMRMIVCPSQIYVILIYYFPIFGWHNISNEIVYKYFEAVIVFFAG